MKVLKKNFKIIFIIVALITLISKILISLKLGSIDITFKELITGIIGIIGGEANWNFGIIKALRMPRVIIAVLVGANLAISGVFLQSVIRNPLADPYIEGVT